MEEGARWDGDERGRGIATAAALADGVAALLDQLRADDWVAEDPHAHLLPHIVRACAAGEDLAVREMRFEEDGLYVLTLECRPGQAPRDLRERIFGVVGAFAESSTHVRQRVVDGAVEFDVVTGMLADDTHFRPHGHLVRLRVEGAGSGA